MGSLQVLKCDSCGLQIDAAKIPEAMGLGGYKKVFMTLSKCPRCQSTKIHVLNYDWKWWEIWKYRSMG